MARSLSTWSSRRPKRARRPSGDTSLSSVVRVPLPRGEAALRGAEGLRRPLPLVAPLGRRAREQVVEDALVVLLGTLDVEAGELLGRGARRRRAHAAGSSISASSSASRRRARGRVRGNVGPSSLPPLVRAGSTRGARCSTPGTAHCIVRTVANAKDSASPRAPPGSALHPARAVVHERSSLPSPAPRCARSASRWPSVAVLVAAAWIALAVLLPHDRVLALVRAQLASSLRREARLADVSVRPVAAGAARGPRLRAGRAGGLRPGRGREGGLPRPGSRRAPAALRAPRGAQSHARAADPAPRAAGGRDHEPRQPARRRAALRAARRPRARPWTSPCARSSSAGARCWWTTWARSGAIFLGLDTRLSLSADGRHGASPRRAARASRGSRSGRSRRAGPPTSTRRWRGSSWTIEHDGRFDGARNTLELERLALGFGRARVDARGHGHGPRDRGPRSTCARRARAWTWATCSATWPRPTRAP